MQSIFVPDEIAFWSAFAKRFPRKAWDFPRASLGVRLGVALGGIRMRTLDVRLVADLMLRAAYLGRLKPGFPSVDQHFLKVRFEKPSFQGVDFCEFLGCSLGFASLSTGETANLGFF
jgi:hypothetical protein